MVSLANDLRIRAIAIRINDSRGYPNRDGFGWLRTFLRHPYLSTMREPFWRLTNKLILALTGRCNLTVTVRAGFLTSTPALTVHAPAWGRHLSGPSIGGRLAHIAHRLGARS